MFRPENFIHEEAASIRTYEINQHKTISIPAFVKLIQEAAMQHVLHLKLSVWDLEPLHLAWVLIRFPAMTIKVLSMIYWQAFRLWLKKIPYYGHP